MAASEEDSQLVLGSLIECGTLNMLLMYSGCRRQNHSYINKNYILCSLHKNIILQFVALKRLVQFNKKYRQEIKPISIHIKTDTAIFASFCQQSPVHTAQ